MSHDDDEIRQLIQIDPDGTITRIPFNELPEHERLAQLICMPGPGLACDLAEHVTVLWQGKRAHAFVDEMGHPKRLPLNPKATAVYHANTRSQEGRAPYVNLEDAPGPYIDHDAPPVAGRMLLWPYRAPGWE